ncbi:hypothetical protein V6N13_044547 [Hibiscus sabdariffa]|uniref:Uncharacterized protein n=1 Tax=Hibiscus sabdariffa TaxID=183260 RepID=A0ABR2RIS7_9ROSI
MLLMETVRNFMVFGCICSGSIIVVLDANHDVVDKFRGDCSCTLRKTLAVATAAQKAKSCLPNVAEPESSAQGRGKIQEHMEEFQREDEVEMAVDGIN